MEEFINDQVVELDKMEASMKQTVKNKEISEKELNVCIAMYIAICCIYTYTHTLLLLQEALKKKEADLAALEIACEKKDEEIHNLEQSLSQMSTDKEEMKRISTKLAEIEDKLTKANRQLLASKNKVCSNCRR